MVPHLPTSFYFIFVTFTTRLSWLALSSRFVISRTEFTKH